MPPCEASRKQFHKRLQHPCWIRRQRSLPTPKLRLGAPLVVSATGGSLRPANADCPCRPHRPTARDVRAHRDTPTRLVGMPQTQNRHSHTFPRTHRLGHVLPCRGTSAYEQRMVADACACWPRRTCVRFLLAARARRLRPAAARGEGTYLAHDAIAARRSHARASARCLTSCRRVYESRWRLRTAAARSRARSANVPVASPRAHLHPPPAVQASAACAHAPQFAYRWPRILSDVACAVSAPSSSYALAVAFPPYRSSWP